MINRSAAPYNLNPDKETTAARPDHRRPAGIATLTLTRSRRRLDVEYIGETTYDGLNLQIEKRYSDNWGARFSYGLGHGRGNTNGTPTATNDFQVLGERNLGLNEAPTNLDRRHTATLSGRIEVPWIRGLTGGAVARMMTGQAFTIHNSNIDANRNGVLIDPLPAGTYSGVGQNALTVDNQGGRNGVYGPGSLQVDGAQATGEASAGRMLDFFFEASTSTNEPNFANPTGDMRRPPSGATTLAEVDSPGSSRRRESRFERLSVGLGRSGTLPGLPDPL